MNRRTPEETRFYKIPHPYRLWRELQIMTRCNPEIFPFRQLNKIFRLSGCYRKGLFYVYVASGFQAFATKREMTLRRGGYMHDCWPDALEHFLNICKNMRNMKPISKLLRH